MWGRLPPVSGQERGSQRLAAAVRWLAQGSPVSHVSISDSGFGFMSLSCSGVKLPVGGLLEELGGLCRGCSAASRWMALDSGRSCVPHFFVDNLLRVPPVMSGLHIWWSGRPLFFYISNLHKNKKAPPRPRAGPAEEARGRHQVGSGVPAGILTEIGSR